MKAAKDLKLQSDQNQSSLLAPPLEKLCIDPTQCAALVDLYNATNGDKWTRNDGWLNGSSYCDWNWLEGYRDKFGVTCDSSGNVIKL